jgi:hypothetical protein
MKSTLPNYEHIILLVGNPSQDKSSVLSRYAVPIMPMSTESEEHYFLGHNAVKSCPIAACSLLYIFQAYSSTLMMEAVTLCSSEKLGKFYSLKLRCTFQNIILFRIS